MISDFDNITGIILAGGASRRMGRDKSHLAFGDTTFIENLVQQLQRVTNKVIIVSDRHDYDYLKIPVIKDHFKNSGPLAGIHAGLTKSATKINLILPNDMPLVTFELLREVLKNFDYSYDALWCMNDAQEIPLLGVYKKKMADQCKLLLDQNEKRLLQLNMVGKIQKFSIEKKFIKEVQNINTPEQYERIHHGYNN